MRISWLLLLLMIPFAFASIEYDVPPEAEFDDTITISMRISGASTGDAIIASELLPPESEIIDWFIVGSSESQQQVDFTQSGRTVIWEFTAARSSPTIVYTVRLPDFGESADFDGVYATSSGSYARQTALVGLFAAEIPEPVEQQEPTSVVEEVTEPVVEEEKKFSWKILLAVLVILVGLTLIAFNHIQKNRIRPLDQEQMAYQPSSSHYDYYQR